MCGSSSTVNDSKLCVIVFDESFVGEDQCLPAVFQQNVAL